MCTLLDIAEDRHGWKRRTNEVNDTMAKKMKKEDGG